MITPRKVFRYSAAATAGYAVTAPIVEWLLSVGRSLAIVAVLSFIGAIASVMAWVGSARPIDSHWALIYFAICCVIFAAAVIPLAIGIRCFRRYLETEEKDPING